jgi:predicted nucleic acid-binding Zn ribbon protein
MEKAADLLGRVARRLGHRNAALVWLSSTWRQIVGETLAAHTRPVRCEAGCLEVAADAGNWQMQLDEMQRDFCARVNHAWGGPLVREVKFVAVKRGAPRVGPAPDQAGAGGTETPIRRLPYELDNEHTPFIRRRKS